MATIPYYETTSTALLRARIQEILKGRKSNLILSTPPPLPPITENLSSTAMNCLPLSNFEKLNLNSEEFTPLSTPPNGELELEEGWSLILVTGGSGFIGSHTVLEILQQGKYGVVVIDSLANSNIEVLSRVRTLATKFHLESNLSETLHPPLYFHECDITDSTQLSKVMELYSSGGGRNKIFSAIHFAALKSVSGSLSNPINYYQTNVTGTINLISILSKWNVKKLVFSSSCVVYGSNCDGEGIKESDCIVTDGGGTGITNPYGRTKRICEEILADLSASDPEWQTMSLRYTNPSGAHPSGWIGEDPTNAANLMPIVTHVLQGKREQVMIYGADYDTPDGTGIRDFIHVIDLAKAHLSAITAMITESLPSRNNTYNLGTNQGTSVLTVIETLSQIAQRSIKIQICDRRPGDLGCVVCDATKAEIELGWKAKIGIFEMCRDLINWQALNPDGYATVDNQK